MKELSHLDEAGRIRMVDVGDKPTTARRAVASGRVHLSPDTFELFRRDALPKGDAAAAVRLSGIQGAKLTSQLIPLCHPLALDRVDVKLQPEPANHAVRVFVEARVRGATGVEMEALTGVSVAALVLIDMIKAVDRSAWIGDVRLELKEGGKSGRWTRPDHEDPWHETTA